MVRRLYAYVGAIALVLWLGATSAATPATTAKSAVAPTKVTAPAGKTIDARPWPREYAVDGVSFSIYRPQIDSWNANRLEARSVMAVKTGETKDPSGKSIVQQEYGVLWLSARTETDKEAREVTLDNIVVEKANFPTAKDKEASYLALARKAAPTTQLVASLNQIESSLAMTQAGNAGAASQPVDNDPPEIVFTFQPAALVLIDGKPVLKPTSVAGVERVVNTRAAVFRYQGAYYVGHAGRWATGASADGTWALTTTPPALVVQAGGKAVAAAPATAAQQKAQESEAIATAVKPAAVAAAKVASKPAEVIARTHRAELIVVDGDPAFEDIPRTSLNFKDKTQDYVQIDGGGTCYDVNAVRSFTS
ncbi:MAG: hypothetical protein ACREEG_15415, partial [Phenylobacterium sp.]